MYDVNSELHTLRVEIDRVIQRAQRTAASIGRDKAGREIALVVTKLQEAKMWAGKGLEAVGSKLPEQYRDEATE